MGAADWKCPSTNDYSSNGSVFTETSKPCDIQTRGGLPFTPWQPDALLNGCTPEKVQTVRLEANRVVAKLLSDPEELVKIWKLEPTEEELRMAMGCYDYFKGYCRTGCSFNPDKFALGKSLVIKFAQAVQNDNIRMDVVLKCAIQIIDLKCKGTDI